MTVFELRKEIAKRLARSIRPNLGCRREAAPSTGQSTSEDENIVGPSTLSPSGNLNDTFGPHELLVLRQTPLSYEVKSANQHGKHYVKAEQLGSLLLDQSDVDRPVSTLASPSDEEEKIVVSEYVSNHDRVYINWPQELVERSFDAKEFENVDDQSDNAARIQSTKNKTKSVLDCIDKFCQKEQLEETEQWYCNKCKMHVRAWKQFHLYRSSPHLIVHLKRFHFSPTTHRRNKITALVDFPLKGLDLSEHVIHWSDENNDKPIYDCYAVTNHFGGLGGGHYTAYALNPDDTWCLYDDSRITSGVNPKDVVSNAAYVLYYRRRDVPVTEEFELNLQTGATIQFENGPTLIQNDRESKTHSSPSSRSSSIAGSNVAVVHDGIGYDDCDTNDYSNHIVQNNNQNSNSDDDYISADDEDDDALLSDDGQRYVVDYVDGGKEIDNDIDNNIDADDDDDEGTSDRTFLPHPGKTTPTNIKSNNNNNNHRFDRDRDGPSNQLPRQ
jgi:Ubiquitin carboxyl-terminal hydrolase